MLTISTPQTSNSPSGRLSLPCAYGGNCYARGFSQDFCSTMPFLHACITEKISHHVLVPSPALDRWCFVTSIGDKRISLLFYPSLRGEPMYLSLRCKISLCIPAPLPYGNQVLPCIYGRCWAGVCFPSPSGRKPLLDISLGFWAQDGFVLLP